MHQQSLRVHAKQEIDVEEGEWYHPLENMLGRLLTETITVMRSFASYIDYYINHPRAKNDVAPHYWGVGMKEYQVLEQIKRLVLTNYRVQQN